MTYKRQAESADIADGAVLDAEVGAGAAIAASKISGVALTESALSSNSPGFWCRPQDSTSTTGGYVHASAYYLRFTAPSLLAATKMTVSVAAPAGAGSYVTGAICHGGTGATLRATSSTISVASLGTYSGALTSALTLYPGVSYYAAIWVFLASGTLTLTTYTPPTAGWTANTVATANALVVPSQFSLPTSPPAVGSGTNSVTSGPAISVSP